MKPIEEHYVEIEELSRLSLAELQDLWESVPTEDQAYLVRVFEREASKRQVVEDIDEARMAHYFLEQYRVLGFVPSGDVWVKVPPIAREQYKRPIVVTQHQTEEMPAKTKSALPKWLVLMTVPFLCLALFAVFRAASGGSSRTASLPTPTSSPSPTFTPFPTITPTSIPPTATPFGLSGFDEAIISGQRVSRNYYPVQLQIFPNRQTQPRVFIVQEQKIGVAEWGYDNNPDIVSWLGGMVIKPVLGVPFSPSNLELFRQLGDESVFVVTMNTGDVWQFVFLETEQVGRTETTYFKQDVPGLVLVLIGEKFSDGTPTDLRYLVRANYPSDQELGVLKQENASLVPMKTPFDVGGVTIAIQEARLIPSLNLPQELAYLVLDTQVITGENTLSSDDIFWQLDVIGEQYSVDSVASGMGNCAPLNGVFSANSATCASVGFIASRYLQQARALVGISPDTLTPFALTVTLPEERVSSHRLEVQLGRMYIQNDMMAVNLRLYNPTSSVLSIVPSDFSLVLGFVPNPTGNVISPFVSPQEIAPQSALDLTLTFPYGGEGFAVLSLLGRVWGIEM